MKTKPTIFVTYVSHHGKNGLPFRCCSEHTDTYSFLDWLKDREVFLQRPTTVVAWHYQSSLKYLPGRQS